MYTLMYRVHTVLLLYNVQSACTLYCITTVCTLYIILYYYCMHSVHYTVLLLYALCTLYCITTVCTLYMYIVLLQMLWSKNVIFSIILITLIFAIFSFNHALTYNLDWVFLIIIPYLCKQVYRYSPNSRNIYTAHP